MQTSRVLFLAAVVLVVATPVRLLAQEPPQDSEEDSVYEGTVRRALQEFELEHWIEAKVLFGQAYALKPNARTLRGLGLACYESRQYVQAIQHLEQALAHPVQPLTPEMIADVQQYLAQARQFVSRAQLDIQPQAAQIAIDGGEPRAAQGEDWLLLDPGVHEIVVFAPGFVSESRRVRAEGGNVIQLKLALQPVPAPPEVVIEVPPPEPAPVAPIVRPTPPGQANTVAPWFVVGISAAIALAGGTLLAVAAVDKSKVENANDGTDWKNYESAYHTGQALFPVAIVMTSVGLVGLAAGLSWQFAPWRSSESPETTLSLQPGYMRLTTRF